MEVAGFCTELFFDASDPLTELVLPRICKTTGLPPEVATTCRGCPGPGPGWEAEEEGSMSAGSIIKHRLGLRGQRSEVAHAQFASSSDKMQGH